MRGAVVSSPIRKIPDAREKQGAFLKSSRWIHGREMKKFFWLLEYGFFRGFAFLLSLIPLRVCYKIADGLGVIAVRFLGIRRRIMLENLRLAFREEKSEAELRKIAEASMQNLLKLTVEFVRTPQVSKDPERYLEMPDMTSLFEAIKKRGHFMAVVSHFGNWEWLAIPVKRYGILTHAIGRPLKNPYLYRYIRHMREAANLKNVDKSGAVRESIRIMKQKGVLAILIDQHESQGAVWVDFFGRKASTSTLPAMLALKYECPVVPAFFYRNECGRSRMLYGAVFPLIKTGDLQADLLANTQQYISRIEEEIRRRPGDWLWAHRRWRKPPEKSSFQEIQGEASSA